MIRDHLTSRPRNKRELAQLVGCPSREVELMIQRARLEGAPICSGPDGYWLSDDPQEVADCARRLLGRLISQAITARALRKTARRLERAPTLWGGL